MGVINMSETDWAAFAEQVKEEQVRRCGDGPGSGIDDDELIADVEAAIGELLEGTRVTFRSKDVAIIVDEHPSTVGMVMGRLESDGVVEKANQTKPYKWRLSSPAPGN